MTSMNNLYAYGINTSIAGKYLNQPFSGIITYVRAAAGNDLKVGIDIGENCHLRQTKAYERLVLSGTAIVNSLRDNDDSNSSVVTEIVMGG